MKYLFFLMAIFAACRNNSGDELLRTKLKDAILQKENDSLIFARFKAENANQFKVFDSLIEIHKITADQQKVHDSLMQTGLHLGMKFIKDLMKINDLKKELE